MARWSFGFANFGYCVNLVRRGGQVRRGFNDKMGSTGGGIVYMEGLGCLNYVLPTFWALWASKTTLLRNTVNDH